MDKRHIVEQMLPQVSSVRASEDQFAPSNIALCKYWGKRDKTLNLPINPSLSVSLGNLGTQTALTPIDQPIDEILLNGAPVAQQSSFAVKVSDFIDLFRRGSDVRFRVDTRNNIPTAAGLASSASGFAALTFALNQSFDFDLDSQTLSVLARLGSGSACRSVYSGFVEWQMGHREDGMDSHAYPLDEHWPGLAIGLVKVDETTKAVDSRSGMQRTLETSQLYQSWPKQASLDLVSLHEAIAQRDFDQLGQTAENNALSMHATMISSWPPLLYWQPESIAVMQQVWGMRAQGVSIYFTMDAGPNLKLLFLNSDRAAVLNSFPDLEIIEPFEY